MYVDDRALRKMIDQLVKENLLANHERDLQCSEATDKSTSYPQRASRDSKQSEGSSIIYAKKKRYIVSVLYQNTRGPTQYYKALYINCDHGQSGSRLKMALTPENVHSNKV